MNCKPGDLAIVKPPQTGGYCEFTGRMVEVIEPLQTDHYYPDIGLCHHKFAANPGEWFCKFIGGAPEVMIDEGALIITMYGRMWDSRLRPIRGGESPEQSIEAMRDLMQTKKEKETT